MAFAKFLKFPRIFILLLLISYASVSAVIFTPGLPRLAEDFGISEEMAQWTMSLYLVGYALGQLPYGPIANRFGRKKAIYIGLSLAILGTLVCYLAWSFPVLCLGRFLQAMGAASGLKLTFTMISDTQTKETAARALSLLMLAFVAMPAIGVAISGYITVFWGWKGCFGFLSLYSIILRLLCLSIPETSNQLDRDALKPKRIIHGYARQFKDSFMVLHAMLGGLTTALLYVFATLAPYVGILKIGMSPDKFGLWSFIPYSGLFIGILYTRSIVRTRKPSTAILLGILIGMVGILGMTIAFANHWVNYWTLFMPMFLVQMGDSLIYTFAATTGVAETSDKSNASAVMQFITIGMATVSIFIIGFFPPAALMTLPVALGIIAFSMLVIWLKLRTRCI